MEYVGTEFTSCGDTEKQSNSLQLFLWETSTKIKRNEEPTLPRENITAKIWLPFRVFWIWDFVHVLKSHNHVGQMFSGLLGKGL